MNPRRCGTPARGGAKRIRPSAPSAWFAGHRSLYSIHTTVGAAPPHASAHSLGNAIIFIWGPNFEMLPHSIARSAARTVAGQTLKNEPAEVRDSGTGWREENSALCSQRLVRRASLVVLDTHDGRCSSPTCLCSLPGECNHLYLGAE